MLTNQTDIVSQGYWDNSFVALESGHSPTNLSVYNIGSISGYECYVNQGVRTSDSPTFNSLTLTSNLSVTGTITASDPVTIFDTTGSTSKDTGALIVEGGVGIEENLTNGGNFNVTGEVIVSDTTMASVSLV